MNMNNSTQTTNTYMLNPEDPAETARLIDLDRTVTQEMGGPLVGVPDLPGGAQVLDVGCGPGGWVLDVAFERPDIEVAGVDRSNILVEYAYARARTQKLSNASFGVMDITRPLDFSDNSFDLVNARFLTASLSRDAWLPLLKECRRILRPSGLVRLTEPVDAGVTNSPAFERFQVLIAQAARQLGYGFSVDGRTFALSYMLPRLLRQTGYHEISVQAYAQEISYESLAAWTDFFHNARIAYALGQSVLTTQDLITQKAIEELYQQMLIQRQQHEVCGMWHWISVLARKPAGSTLEGE